MLGEGTHVAEVCGETLQVAVGAAVEAQAQRGVHHGQRHLARHVAVVCLLLSTARKEREKKD